MLPDDLQELDLFPESEAPYELLITLDYPQSSILLEWTDSATNIPAADLRVRCTGPNELTWELQPAGGRAPDKNSHDRSAIHSRINRFRKMFRVDAKAINCAFIPCDTSSGKPKAGKIQLIDLPLHKSAWTWLEENIASMAEALGRPLSPLDPIIEAVDPVIRRQLKRWEKLEQELAVRETAIQEGHKRRQEQQRRREAARQARQHLTAAKAPASPPAPPKRAPVPAPALNLDFPRMEFQETFLSQANLRSYFLLERGAQWWVSNQCDDLLALPYCRIERLEYQIRTALRVIGPLRGRALLSDEVGLGKTIEAGLVMKEYLTRGMIHRFLVLTVPSLVDQWEEELQEKFQLESATTNHPSFRADPAEFWRKNQGIIASLHTLKQPAHLAIAKEVTWDMLVIDEAHYLRNRSSQAWEAVNALPRQFLLLLTATPVQNSLEELYNLVTLLHPGQLPAPNEFRHRFIDKKRPHQPREPEELRRLLGQVMIRNTRANAGVNLPPRRAETVLFEPEESERRFWEKWERELREALGRLNPSLSSLWGRLLLQTAGSSPAAWLAALKSFPIQTVALEWGTQAPLELSWAKKCNLIIPLTQGAGGVVIFTQFIETQAALANHLQSANVPTHVIHGQTPAPKRQPITEDFRQNGGALLLTHSGTEGRNLQFCHRLVNFDLPWNPMEIEQRIGRLHRLGQKEAVSIYNLVQAGTLQEHLLHILQEKLNLFELVVGETGLILGERFSSDEFAEEVLRRWRDSEGRVAESMQSLGEELAAARGTYTQIKQLDETLFAKDYESL